MEEKTINKNHKIILNNRQNGSFTGIVDVLSFDIGEILLETEMGMLHVKGKDLHVNRLNLEKGEVIRCFGENDIQGVRLFFVAGLYPSENGLYVCNWQGHDKNAVEAKSPQVFEMNNKGEVIWSLNDNEKFGMISTICSIK